MDPTAAITTTVGAANIVTDMYTKIKEARAKGREKKLKNLAEEKLAFKDSDRQILELVERGKCDGIKAKDLKKLMKDVFRRNPEQQLILGHKVQKCYEIEKKSKRAF
jgi:hypothetical protein